MSCTSSFAAARFGDQDWSYTPDGLPLQVTTANDGGANTVSNSYAYNKRRLPTVETQLHDINSWSITYGYNANGHQASLGYPANFAVAFHSQRPN